MTDQATQLPLHGVRVLELGNYIAAPTAGRVLADFGAEVIKVERPGTGDELRNWRLYAGDVSMLFRTINRNKKSVVLDLKSEHGRDTVLDLVRHCDVVIENFRPGTLERWGLGPARLEEANPDVVLARISGFGQSGPLADRPGFAAVAEAMAGMRHLVGEADRPPSRVGVSLGDSLAGLYAALGVVMSLFQRERSGTRMPLHERTVDVALYEAVFSMMESLVPDYLAYGLERQRVGGRMEGIAPTNAYECGDGHSVVIAGNGDSIYRRYMHAIGRPELADDPTLQSNAERWERREELDAAIGAWTRTMPRDEVLKALDAAGVPAGPIYTAADICTDEQFAARGMLQRLPVTVAEGDIREIDFPGIVPVLGDRSLPVRSLGPDLGQHTRQVLSGLLGKSDEEIDAIVNVTEKKA
ncbi:CoA transferase [Streptomyces sp. ISL-12]|uniref:CaiB/BaiF CoA transferase family protein n=1 Tax=Streptomyces sp. ISL-12 TaxID=2819177 RepID=UPI001BEC0043|nr:CaiB/BaiF CoA-transferase family protein [Streptomyces sp. ISL-12]MBT2412476.1 CoA transferase [Streptomyces sp. ISL-12]